MLAGVALGLAAAAVLTRAMASFLFGVRSLDRLSFAAVSGIMLIAGLLACALPACWTTRVDATSALRAE